MKYLAIVLYTANADTLVLHGVVVKPILSEIFQVPLSPCYHFKFFKLKSLNGVAQSKLIFGGYYNKQRILCGGRKIWILFSSANILSLTPENNIHFFEPLCTFIWQPHEACNCKSINTELKNASYKKVDNQLITIKATCVCMCLPEARRSTNITCRSMS